MSKLKTKVASRRRGNLKPFSVVMVLILIAAVGGVIVPASPVQAQSTLYVSKWTKYEQNPVLSPSQGWEGNRIVDPSIIKDGDTYKMWYTGNQGDSMRIGYATSPDGITWTKAPANPIVPLGGDGAPDKVRAYSCSVIKDDGIYKMWYSGKDADGNTTICYATSNDGINWNKQGRVLDMGQTGEWDVGAVREPTVIKDGSAYKMWYCGWSTFPNMEIGYATSPDGINWTKQGKVLQVTATQWDDVSLYAPEVIKDGSTYHMWYSGGDGGDDHTWLTGHATSTDGINWTKDPGNPVLIEEQTWETCGTETDIDYGGVIKEDTTFKTWYTGYNGTQVRLGLATTSYPNMKYQTIQSAIDAANPGDIINVAAGTYAETITIDKPLTITGDTTNPSNVIINAPTSGTDRDCFDVQADDVTIQGFRIQGAKDTAGNWNPGIYIGEGTPGIQNTTISHNEITDCSYGIFVMRAQHVTISHNKIWACTADDTGYWNGKGIIVYSGGDCPASDTQSYDVDILNNEIFDNELFAIELNADEVSPPDWTDMDVLIEGNIIYNNGGPLYWDGYEAYALYRGISANAYVKGVKITGNEIYNHLPPVDDSFHSSGNSGLGIRASGVKDWTIRSNDIHDNVRGVLAYNGSVGVTLTGNNIYGNAQGIVVGNGDVGYANSNNIHDNDISIYTVKDINPCGVVNLGSGSFDATHNWWGDPSGPSGVGHGTGDAVSDNVNYDPWLDAPYPDGKPISFTGVKEEPVTNGTLDAKTEADTEVVVDGSATVTAAKYSDNPGDGFSGDIGKYIELL